MGRSLKIKIRLSSLKISENCTNWVHLIANYGWESAQSDKIWYTNQNFRQSSVHVCFQHKILHWFPCGACRIIFNLDTFYSFWACLIFCFQERYNSVCTSILLFNTDTKLSCKIKSVLRKTPNKFKELYFHTKP